MRAIYRTSDRTSKTLVEKKPTQTDLQRYTHGKRSGRDRQQVCACRLQINTVHVLLPHALPMDSTPFCVTLISQWQYFNGKQGCEARGISSVQDHSAENGKLKHAPKPGS